MDVNNVAGGGLGNKASGNESRVSDGHGCEVTTDGGWGIRDIDFATTGCVTTNLPEIFFHTATR